MAAGLKIQTENLAAFRGAFLRACRGGPVAGNDGARNCSSNAWRSSMR